MSSQKILEVQKSVKELQSLYNEDPRQESFNALILGEHGSGKTYLLRTCRLPIHIDSFDPGGTKSIQDMIKSGKAVADVRYEAEDPETPSAFRDWKEIMKKRIKSGYFNYFGTYVLDSSTTWSDAIMNNILKLANLAGKPPRWAHDYVPQKVEIRNWVGKMLALPCDFIMTGHLEGKKDEVSGGMSYRFMTTGKGVVTLPLLFDELYVMDPKETSAGVEYRILTKSTGRHIARSRLAKGGLLEKYEEPNIKKILKKAGLSTNDKPLISELGG